MLIQKLTAPNLNDYEDPLSNWTEKDRMSPQRPIQQQLSSITIPEISQALHMSNQANHTQQGLSNVSFLQCIETLKICSSVRMVISD